MTRLPLCIVRKPTVVRPKRYRSAVTSPKTMVGWNDDVFGRRAAAISQALIRSGGKRPVGSSDGLSEPPDPQSGLANALAAGRDVRSFSTNSDVRYGFCRTWKPLTSCSSRR